MIHEDEVLKENAGLPGGRAATGKQPLGGVGAVQQQQRKTFGVLNNVQLGARAHAQKTVIYARFVCVCASCACARNQQPLVVVVVVLLYISRHNLTHPVAHGFFFVRRILWPRKGEEL